VTDAQIATSAAPVEQAPNAPKIRGLTIDDVTSRDLDDAVWTEEGEDGSTKVFVTIALASDLVRLGSRADALARTHVETRYDAHGHAPMLPRGMEERVSLLPGQFRHGLTVELTYGPAPDFALLGAEVFLSKIVSKAKLAYGAVPEILATPGHVLHEPMGRMMAVAQALLNRRRRRGALVLYDLAHGWVATEEGHVRKLERAADAAGHILVQELAIAANEAMATWAKERGVPILYRVHQAIGDPSEARDLLVQALGDATETGDAVTWLDELRAMFGKRMHRAEYSAEPAAHFGLNLHCYTHASSPIRRYADLVTQRQIAAALGGGPLPHTREEIAAIAGHINSTLALVRDARSEGARAASNTKAERALSGERTMRTLIPVDFERVVKVAARSGEDAPEVLVDAFLERLAAGNMPALPQCVALLEPTLSTGAGSGWQRIRAAILAMLAEKPCNAVTILAIAGQVFAGWVAPMERCDFEGPDHARTFRSVRRRGDVEVAQTARTAKEASQRSAVALLAALVGLRCPFFAPEPEPAAPAPPAVKAKAWSPEGKDPVSALQEHAQAFGNPSPTYDFEMSGPSHAPSFTCTSTYRGDETTGAGNKKRDAQKNAAAAQIYLLTR
jgi:ribonuclease R